MFESPPGHASPLSLQCISMVNRSWACLTWCHIQKSQIQADCWQEIMEDGVQVSWGHLWRCYVDYDWFERAPFEGASVPSAVGAQTWKKQGVSFHKIRVKWVQRDEVRVQEAGGGVAVFWKLTLHQTMAQCRRGPWEEPHRSQHRSSCPGSSYK